MQIKKFVATGLTALMAGATLMGGAFALTSNPSGLATPDLGSYPSSFGNAGGVVGNLDAIIVVGSAAAPSDVVGAIDVAANLAGLSYTSVATTTSSSTGQTSIGLNGLEKDGIDIGTSSGGSTLSTGASKNSNAFPSTTVKQAQFSGLWQGQISFNGTTTYNAHEQVDVSGIKMRHLIGDSNINGTEKMIAGTSGSIKAAYVFDSAISNVGSTSAPNYNQPLKFTFLGRQFTVTGVDSSSIKLLSGTVGTAVRNAGTNTGGVSYGNYTVWVTAGSDGNWATLAITDATGRTVDTLSNAKPGTTQTSNVAGIDVKVTSVRVSGTDPTTQHIEADVVVGPVGQTEVTYTSSPDTSSSSKVGFPGAPGWYITFQPGSSTAGNIAAAAQVNAEYWPSTTQYLTAGQTIALPNNYGQLLFEGFGTSNFATVTVQQIGPITGYNSTNGSPVGLNSLYGVKISADSNSVGSGALGTPNWYPAMYLLFNQTYSIGTNAYLPVIVGYQNTAGQVQINDTLTTQTVTTDLANAVNGSQVELGYGILNTTSAGTSTVFPFKLNYKGASDTTFWLNITVDPRLSVANVPGYNLAQVGVGGLVGVVGSTTVSANFENATTFKADTAQLTTTLLRLGNTANSAEVNDVNATSEGTVSSVGTTTQEVVDDSGLLVENAGANAGSDKVVLHVPSTRLAAKVFFGATGTGPTTSSTSGNSVNAVVPVTNSIGRLDTELTAADKLHSIVSVGGPAVNSLSAQLLGLTFPTYGAASGIPQNTALIEKFPNFFTNGENVVLVAGYSAADTRLGTSVLQNYATKLAGITQSTVWVTGTSVANAVITPQTAATATNATPSTTNTSGSK